MLPYPAEDEGTVLLRDGTPVFMRPMRAADAMALLRTYDRLSEETLYFRFFSVPPRDAKKAEYLADVDYDGRYALIAEVRGEIVAGARYERLAERPTTAETAFTIEDAWQGRGLGSLLLERLVKAARQRGIETLEAELLVDNAKMLHVFEASGYPLSQRASSGVLHLEFGTARNAEADERSFARRVRGSAASARLVLSPKSIGVYGASRNPDKLGTRLLVGLAANGFNGPLVAVHPQSRSLAGVRCVPSLCDSEGFAAELAVICLPPSELPFALDDAARAGARAAVLVSSGYSETGPEGRVLEEAIVRRAHESGMRLLGPNSLGTINTKPEVRLFAGSARSPRRGHVALGTQSSALGLLALGDALRRGIGVSSAAALGNKCDLGELELLAHWAEDPETRAVLLHLESFDDPEAFTRLARRAVKEKPVVVLHAGRSREGARAAASHTGALAPAGVHVTALLESAGVLVVQTFEELLDAAALFGAPVLPTGRRIAVLTNAGGPGVLAADACVAAGLTLPEHPPLANPLVLPALTPPETYAKMLAALLASPGIDGVLALPVALPRAESPVAALRSVAESSSKPVLLAGVAPAHGVETAPLGLFASPHDAARAWSLATAWERGRARVWGTPRTLEPEREADLRARLQSLTPETPGTIVDVPLDDAFAILSAAGIPIARYLHVKTLSRALSAAAEIGYPVAVKAVGPALKSRAAARGLHLHVDGPAALRRAYRDLDSRLGSSLDGVLIQEMAIGVEMLLGTLRDPFFGPLVACGFGGTAVELESDVSYRRAPISENEASSLLRSLRGTPRLEGYRGAPLADVAALVDALLRVAALTALSPGILEMDVNPFVVCGSGARAVDVHLRLVAPSPPHRRKLASF